MLYLIRCEQYIKIGVSDAPKKRIATIQTSNPTPIEVLAVIPGSYDLEAEMHKRFSHLRHNGEWFHDSPEIREAVMRLQPAGPPASPMPPDYDNWRFEVKRKPRKASRRYSGSTAGDDWYYWLVRVHSSGRSVYYGTLDVLALPTPPAPAVGEEAAP